MFRKLIKNEFRNTWRLMAIINGTLVGMHLIMLFFTDLIDIKARSYGILRHTYNLYTSIYVLTLVGIQFAVFLFFAVRYFKKVYSDQGYLTHTLPVKKAHITNAMVISSTFWTLVTAAVTLSYPLLRGAQELSRFMNMRMVMDAFEKAGITSYTVISLVITGILGTVCYYVLVFVSITIGQNWKKHPMLGSILVFWISHTLLQVIGLWSIVTLVEGDLLDRTWVNWVGQSFGRVLTTLSTGGNILAVILITIGLVVNNLIMKKRLNL